MRGGHSAMNVELIGLDCAPYSGDRIDLLGRALCAARMGHFPTHGQTRIAVFVSRAGVFGSSQA